MQDNYRKEPSRRRKKNINIKHDLPSIMEENPSWHWRKAQRKVCLWCKNWSQRKKIFLRELGTAHWCCKSKAPPQSMNLHAIKHVFLLYSARKPVPVLTLIAVKSWSWERTDILQFFICTTWEKRDMTGILLIRVPNTELELKDGLTNKISNHNLFLIHVTQSCWSLAIRSKKHGQQCMNKSN